MLVSQTSLVEVEHFFVDRKFLLFQYICIYSGHVSENALLSVFTHASSGYANFLEQKKFSTHEKMFNSYRTGLEYRR